ncbi:MAG: hypothetical protein C4520_18560 [Candidatus Abyssobacteria bacterium SURF_5]|uniref:Uncharacterized protein n=1 Tax=Abyssobacteria bacterium (strain SURF_5) TaxID=2093360 RepID=A0A3A4NE47_ABYX5|nr:MAG: hypothetical protein C4520_18560 [Candidatus Abyssubacteria bacterium SURF_5]
MNHKIIPTTIIFGAAAVAVFIFARSAGASTVSWPLFLAIPFLFPAMMLSGLSHMLRTKASFALIILIAVSSGAFLIGNVSGWFGYLTGQPHMWHEVRPAEISGREVYLVHFNIQNTGKGPLRLRLDAVVSPEENSLILASQQYDGTQKQWVAYPAERLFSQRSLGMFPAEIRPGGSLLVEMIIEQTDMAEVPEVVDDRNMPGKYGVSISDPIHMKVYHHEITVPPFTDS